MSDLEPELILAIKEILESELKSTLCINRNKIYLLMKEKVNVPYELYEFKLLVTKAIKENKIEGYGIKRGRNGGVTRILDPTEDT